MLEELREELGRFSAAALAAAYRRKQLSPVEVTEAFLQALQGAEVAPVYRVVSAQRARAQAARAAHDFAQGRVRSPLQGVPLALKDMLDVAGEVTASGTKAFLRRAAATADAAVVARLDAAGAVFLGKTQMTELAYSGLGLNPHYGTPANALDPTRVPGGSSSGSAVAVASGLACAAIGSDTGGSVRIPAAFNGLVGLKTTDNSLPMAGSAPLSTTLDTLGPITQTVEDAYLVWLALAGKGQEATPLRPAALRGKRFLLPQTVFFEEAEAAVVTAFEESCSLLQALGVRLEPRDLPALAELNTLYATYGSFPAYEALTLYGEAIAADPTAFDPRVVSRIVQVEGRAATDYIKLGYERQRLQREIGQEMQGFDAMIAPTVAILPPRVAALQSDAAYMHANLLTLRNTTLFNLLGWPALSLPNGPMTGLMLSSLPGTEASLLSLGASLERHREG